MGHDPSVHHNIYQQVSGGLEMVNMGKLLTIHEKNIMSKYKDKSLDDIELEGTISLTVNVMHICCTDIVY